MPIKSYLALPHDGKYKKLLLELSNLNACEILPSNNEELAIIVTDTKNDAEDQKIHDQIKNLKNLKMLSMVSGFETE